MNLLIIFPKVYFERKMSMVRRRVITEMIGKHGATITGPGWEDSLDAIAWNNGRTVQENVFGIEKDLGKKFDAVFWYKPEGNLRDQVPKLIEPDNCPRLTIASYNEAWWRDNAAYHECKRTRTDIVVHHHIVDAVQFDPPKGSPIDTWQPKTIYIPHCADPNLFFDPPPVSERPIDILISGCMNREIYPLRCRLSDLVAQVTTSFSIRPHPGYRLGTLADCVRQEDDYAQHLMRSKMAIVCSSKHSYGLAKYFEVSMAGAIPIGDRNPDIGDLAYEMFSIHPEDTDAKIVRSLKHLLSMPGLADEMGAACRRIALSQFSIGAYCEKFMAEVSDHIDYLKSI